MKIELKKDVIIVGIGNNARYKTPMHKGVISKIGRKWFKVDTGNYIGEREEFSIEDYTCNGRGYMPEWIVYESMEHYEELINKPKLILSVANMLKTLTTDQLNDILKLK